MVRERHGLRPLLAPVSLLITLVSGSENTLSFEALNSFPLVEPNLQRWSTVRDKGTHSNTPVFCQELLSKGGLAQAVARASRGFIESTTWVLLVRRRRKWMQWMSKM